MQKTTCCFTGHRPQNLPFGFNEEDPRCLELKKVLQNVIEKLYESGVRHFITGMAIGVDMYAAEIVIELRKTHPDITLESAIPCETQATRWSVAMQERYYEIASKCDKETMLQHQYTADCMQKRNVYMVDHSDYVVAVWDGTRSGTGNTVEYAKTKGKGIVKIDPVTLKLSQFGLPLFKKEE